MPVNNNFLDIYKIEDNVCSFVRNESANALVLMIMNALRPYSNVLDSCNYTPVSIP